MSQTNLFPVKLEHEESTSGTKDLKLIGHALGGVRYAVKRESDGELLPLAEWLGHHLSRLCGIATPDFDIVECLNGELAFGSRWEENAISITEGMVEADKYLLLSNHAEAISKIFGLDYFLPNQDRHAGNFLFVNRAGRQTCLSMDFSQSSVRLDIPFGSFPISISCHTHYLLNEVFIKFFGNLNRIEFKKPLDTVTTITLLQISAILNAAPDAWFTIVSRQQVIDWWEAFSGDRAAQATI